MTDAPPVRDFPGCCVASSRARGGAGPAARGRGGMVDGWGWLGFWRFVIGE